MSNPSTIQGRNALRQVASRGAFTRAAVLTAVASMGLAPARASIWENHDWALIGDAEASVTYDSNIFAFDGGESDTIVGVTPALTLQRKGSATNLSLMADVNVRYFMDRSDQDSKDPSVLLSFGYPNTQEAMLRQSGRLGWNRINYPDYSIGDRVQRTEMHGNWQGVLRDNGKTRIIANLGGRDTDYTDLNSDVLDFNGGVGVAWSRHELLEYNLSLNYSHAEYSDVRGGIGDATRKGYGLNIGIRGEITPKITGDASIGVGENKYSGSLSGSDTNWSTRANITWSPSERRSLNLNANRGTYFDALGTAYNRTEADFTFRQGMAGGFSGSARLGFGEYDYSEAGGTRKDTYVRVGAGLDYSLTGRFAAGLNFNWTDKGSDLARYEFAQHEIIARASYRF
ncbi:hypothetical protein ASA1KI_15830 [Opitutales bacterium ASA1]|uniref:outer membrane beta-barrel protein n=1 Tax=Congregicoccus parvus TaxID=3081749 RepID=UPI002B30A28B|nr:hypothetical protein ASA1KI_15830 [Opitutales bacterium ASA1]